MKSRQIVFGLEHKNQQGYQVKLEGFYKKYSQVPFLLFDSISFSNANANYAIFWHWVALIKMAERRNLNLEELFYYHFKRIDSHQSNLIKVFKNSKWIKIGKKLGFFKDVIIDI
jgi:hypothetical protein